LKGLSNNQNPVFNKSLADATADLEGITYLDKFFDALKQIQKEL
jgi:SecD/SecF fusion protein